MTNDEVERLIADFADCWSTDKMFLPTVIERATTLLRRLRDERDQARAALEPFARFAIELNVEDVALADSKWIALQIPLDALRTAARVHAETGEKG